MLAKDQVQQIAWDVFSDLSDKVLKELGWKEDDAQWESREEDLEECFAEFEVGPRIEQAIRLFKNPVKEAGLEVDTE